MQEYVIDEVPVNYPVAFYRFSIVGAGHEAISFFI